jgi:hypothetical protein
MAGMPGMDVPPVRPVPAKQDSSNMRGTKMDATKKVPPAEDHIRHGMADTVTTRKDSIRREE